MPVDGILAKTASGWTLELIANQEHLPSHLPRSGCGSDPRLVWNQHFSNALGFVVPGPGLDMQSNTAPAQPAGYCLSRSSFQLR
jgi:hypothetical protein